MFSNMYRLTCTIICLCAGCVSMASSAGNNCRMLDAKLFGRCITAGINASSVKLDSSDKNIADSLNNTISKFEKCSPNLVDIMACSIYVPKCQAEEGSTAVGALPCLEVCKAFVVQCVAHHDGVDFVRKLCGLLQPNSTGCLKPGNLKNISTVADNSSGQICEAMIVHPCNGLGYNKTTLSSNAQQELLKSETIKKIENASSSVKRLVCAELVPPCFPDSKDKLYRACKTSCTEASRNYSQQFTDIFNNTDYCSGLSDHQDETSGGQFCQLQTWPKNGFWPGGLHWALNFQGDNKMTTATPVNVTTVAPATNTTKASLTSNPYNITTTAPTTNTATMPPTSKPHNITTTAPTTNTATVVPTSKQNITTNAPTTNTATVAPTSKQNITTNAPTTNTATVAPTSKQNITTNAPTTEQGENSTTAPSTTNPKATNVTTQNNKNTTAAPVTTQFSTATAASESSSKESTKTNAPTNGSIVNLSTTRPRNTDKGDVHGKKQSHKTKSHMSAGAIAGAAVGTIIGLVLIIALVLFLMRRRRISMQYAHRVMVDMEDL